MFINKTSLSTPWTNSNKFGIPKFPIYNGRIPLNSNSSLYSFQNFMNNLSLPFNFDHAVGITK